MNLGRYGLMEKLVDWKEANLHVLSHVVHYGSSVFEGIRCYSTQNGPAIFPFATNMFKDL